MSFLTLNICDENKDSSDHSLFSVFNYEDPAEHIKVSSLYELDHSKLPHKSPDHLHKIRVVMVNEKTRMRVSLRFPSIYSLRSYFNETEHTKKKDSRKKLPAFDDKYMVGSEVAAEALYRRISSQEIAGKSSSWSFWVLKNPSVSPQKVSDSPRRSANANVGARKLSLISELKGTGMAEWGHERRQVRFLAKHVEDKREIVAVSNDVVKGEEEKHSDGGDDTEEEEEEEGDVKVVVNKSREAKRKLCKRKGQGGPGGKSSPKKKRPKSEKKNQVAVYKQKKNKVIKKFIDRWSAERYKMAEVSMLKVMKEQNAVFRNPILRPELRAEARKLIGDTGLLDHLLKQMAGKVAPGGEERFKRRHNADGAMEYWLEKANLVHIRKEAGVQDPYWTPPPGWKPGDNPTQDPVCAREIKELRKEIDEVKREMVSRKYGKELAIMAVPNSSPTSQDKEHGSLVIPLKEMYIDLVNKKVKMEEQLMGVSHSLCGMEEEMKKLKTRVKKLNRTESTERPALLIGSTESTTPAGSGRKGKEVMVLGELAQEQCQSSGGNIPPTTKSAAPTEDRAAKIERLKSGFRICKPQGSFLWPDMTASTPHPQGAVQLQDLIAVHTPSSVSSTSPKQSYLLFTPHGPRHTSPVKESAERRAVTISQSTAATTRITFPPLDRMIHNQYEKSSISTSTTITNTIKTPLINLNEPLNTNQTDDYGVLCWSHSHAHAQSPLPFTYQRRHHQDLTTNIAMPSLGPAKKEMMSQWEEGDPRKGMIRNCEQAQQQMGCSCASSIASSSMSMEVGTWLALASSKPSVEHKSKRG
ncbi:PREDICTED: LOW QUALITY PROTEIN: protein DYAD-like [Populus euphratica]|uniref:LOW QUALITY PROTEIN: protein DYAD-like n=1 Tax=Populus euphratica TaxID=75702 RepID=A0AAJ6TVY3_POPEU|nr:PREDICTED: LOW QUALITY PROTEIN: protein DYAD-like [Populus euphratica]